MGLVALLAGCEPSLPEGEWGTFRYFGEVQGEPPMTLLAPFSDRSGNVYVVQGARSEATNAVWVAHARGGWSGGCSAHAGSFGEHGFVGRAEEEAWLWSGDLLVRVDGTTGGCGKVLSTDPTTGAALTFRAVLPAVRSTPSRTSLVAWVQSATDELPYVVTVDLDEENYRSVEPFPEPQAEDVVVLGTGALDDGTRGWVLFAYTVAGDRRVEAWAFDEDGRRAEVVRVEVEVDLPEFSVLGSLQVADNGVVAGLLEDGRVVAFDSGDGGVFEVTDMDPAGVTAWDGKLYVLGTVDGEAAFAPLQGGLQSARSWTAAREAAAALVGTLQVRDERVTPHAKARWDEVRSALGPAPLVSEWPLDPYAVGVTGWLVAGPGYETGLGPWTAVAFAPVGVAF
jgi:hypothetical protein